MVYKILNDPSLTKNFRLSEIVCKCGCQEVIIDNKTNELLQKLREVLGRPIIINSGYRCKKHNVEVGGAPQSKHMLGLARDIRVKGLSPLDVAYAAEKIGFTGIGIYTHNGNKFTHVDTRDKKTLWCDQPNKTTIGLHNLSEWLVKG